MFTRSPNWHADRSMFTSNGNKADEGDDWAMKNLEEMRSRHPMFRMPNWMSDDDDMSNLSSRMSQTPHFGSASLRGPWRERRDSGSQLSTSAPEDGDSVDGHHRVHSTPIQIPIRIEAEAPPGYVPSPTQKSQEVNEIAQKSNSPSRDVQDQPHMQEEHQHINLTEPQLCVGNLRKQPQYASRTTTAVNDLRQEDVPRDARCASAPPNMPDPLNPNKYVSSIKVSPQNSSGKSKLGSSPVFNSVPKPYSKVPHEAPPLHEEKKIPSEMTGGNQQVPPQFEERHESNPSYSPQQHFSHQQWSSGTPKTSLVRNIPIMIEGRDEDTGSPSRSPTKKSHHPEPEWNQTMGDTSFRCPPSHGFSRQEPSYDFPTKMTHEIPKNQFPHFQQQYHPQTTVPQSEVVHEPIPIPVFKQTEQHKDSEMEDERLNTAPIDSKLEAIARVKASITEYVERANHFNGVKMDKEYLYLDEMLTRALLKLDDIDPDGRDDVRQARKTLIKDINDTLGKLEKMAKDKNNQDNKAPEISTTNFNIDSNSEGDKLEAPCIETGGNEAELASETPVTTNELSESFQENTEQPIEMCSDPNAVVVEAKDQSEPVESSENI